jgi:hypothetical protein
MCIFCNKQWLSSQGKDKGDRLDSAWFFGLFLALNNFACSFWLILAFFAFFCLFLPFFGFSRLFFCNFGSFWLFLALFGTLQLFAVFSIGTVHCLPPRRIVFLCGGSLGSENQRCVGVGVKSIT